MTRDARTARPTTGSPGARDLDTHSYEIRVGGHLGSRWAAWFDGLDLSVEPDGTTVISGPVVDQAALHGLLQKLRDTGIPLVSLTRLPSDPTAHRQAEQNRTDHDQTGATP